MSFLKQIARNNDRDWFKENKGIYDTSQQEFKDFVFTLGEKMKAHDVLDDSGTKIYRIYRDVRFSKDKTPYNLHRSAHFTRASESRRGGYYLRVEPGASVIAGGFWRPNPEDLNLIRKQIEQNPDELREILNSDNIEQYFGNLEGEKVKTAPKGYTKDHPAIDLLRHKGFILVHNFTDEEVLSNDFIDKASEGFSKMRPFLDYMTEIVTTDLNGESLIEQ
ncbi:DUF2461 domain-containing protein [Fulvivirga aurantia]|uniref:DUF2461 domain-containing protein n=1 Tax=Fulvivirga aurantia TaxID=2529383 RepID=UPI001FE9569B|nr:DUF2461 domain-containing protein [Fulvivirga aurantia]